jgi:cytochrome c553
MGWRDLELAVSGGMLSVAVILACGCGGAAASAGGDTAGRQAYRQLGCGSCHGPDGQGLRTAPPLRGLSARWSEDQLVAFLRDPRATRARRPQLQALAGQYPVDMAGFPNAPEETLRAVARYVLTR